MKNINLIGLLLFSIISFAQNKILNVSYEIYYNTEAPVTQHANLFVCEICGKSIFKKVKETKNSEKVEKKSDGNLAVTFKSKKTNYNYIDIKNDSLYSVENIFGEDYFITEKIPVIEWQLINEEKTIDSIKVSKAIGVFRGRKYIAWYSIDYPIRVGPWKLFGLPGLIFEAYDETRRYNWTLKKIEYVDFSNDLFIIEKNELKNITIKEYPNIKYNIKSLNERIMSNLPRGSSLENTKMPRNGLEIKFEWEE